MSGGIAGIKSFALAYTPAGYLTNGWTSCRVRTPAGTCRASAKENGGLSDQGRPCTRLVVAQRLTRAPLLPSFSVGMVDDHVRKKSGETLNCLLWPPWIRRKSVFTRDRMVRGRRATADARRPSAAHG